MICFFRVPYSTYHMAFCLSILLHHGNIELLVFLAMRPLRRTKEVKTHHSLLYTRLEIQLCFYHEPIKTRVRKRNMNPVSFFKMRGYSTGVLETQIGIFFLSLKLISYSVSQ